MRSLRERRPSPAMVVACISLFVAAGGTSYAAVKLPKNSVGSAQLKSNSITSAKVRNGSLKEGDFANGQLPAGPQGLQGPRGADGAKGKDGTNGTNGQNGLLGTVVVRRTDIALPDPPGGPGVPGAWQSAFATCNAGEKIIGGSVNVTNGDRAEVNISRPALDNAGAGGIPDDGEQFTFWKGTARTFAGFTGVSMRVFAICVQQP
jgi:hypothetical protein